MVWGRMSDDQATDDDIEPLQACLARLKRELMVLDQLGVAIAAIKVSEACDALELKIDSFPKPSQS
jgi:hypothetical protein